MKETRRSHLRATCGTIIAARLEPPVHAFLVEHMPTRKQPQVLLWVVIFQTYEALEGQANHRQARNHIVNPQKIRTRSTHIGATRPIFSYSVSEPTRITSRPELSMSSFDAVCGLACPSSSASSSNESRGSVPMTSW